jgi:hypothetical protein
MRLTFYFFISLLLFNPLFTQEERNSFISKQPTACDLALAPVLIPAAAVGCAYGFAKGALHATRVSCAHFKKITGPCSCAGCCEACCSSCTLLPYNICKLGFYTGFVAAKVTVKGVKDCLTGTVTRNPSDCCSVCYNGAYTYYYNQHDPIANTMASVSITF